MGNEERKTILLVEDEAIIAVAESVKIKQFGYNVIIADSGEKAVEIVRENPSVSLVLMDINLGKGIDGTEAARRILGLKSIPIVFLTSHSEKEYVDKVKEITRYGYVLKNSGDFVLRSSIEMAFELFEAHQKSIESEEKYSAAFRTSPDAVNINDISGIYVDINEGFTKLTGFTREDVIGINSSEIKIWSIPEDRVRLLDGLKSTGLVENLESLFRCKDGTLKTALMSARIIKINNQPHILSITRDITGRKMDEDEIKRKNEELTAANEELMSMNEEYQAANEELMESNSMLEKVEAELRESEEIFSHFMKHSPIHVFFKDDQIRSLRLSDNFEKMLGRPMKELLGKTMDDLFPSDLAKSMIRDDLRIMQEGKGISTDEELNGRYYRSIKFPINIGGKPRYLAGFTIDITEQKLAEQALREGEDKYRTLFETMIQGVVYQDGEGKIIDANPAALKILGLSIEQMQGRTSIDPSWKSIHEDGSNFPGDTHPSMVALKTGKAVHNTKMGVYNPEKGNYTWINVNAVPQFRTGEERPCQVFATFEDITERRLAEEALKESEERFRKLLQGVPAVAVQGYGLDGTTKYWNRASERFYGYTEEEAIGRNLLDLIIPPEMRDEVKRAIGQMGKTGEPIPSSELSLMRKDGSRITVFSSHAYVQVPGREPELFCIDVDLTERKEMEESLRIKDFAIESAINAKAIAGLDGILSYVNQAFIRMWGFESKADVIGKSAVEFWQMGDKAEEVMEVVRTRGGWIGELTARKKDGTTFDVQMSTSIVQDMNGRPVCMLASFVDITARKIAESKISDLLRDKEILLKEVHHRIKNNMSTMISMISLQSDLLENPSAIAALTDARSRLQAMEVLYDKLYRSENLREMPVKDYLGPLIDEIIDMFPNSDSVKVSKKIDDIVLDVKTISALGIIVNELITNAMKYAFIGRDAGTIELSLTVKDKHATMVIKDNGCGIPATIGIGSSKQFGLNLVDMLTKQMKGAIRIVRGKGAKIILEFDIQHGSYDDGKPGRGKSPDLK